MLRDPGSPRVDWVRDYALLAMRLERAARVQQGPAWLLDYFGPSEWRSKVASEPVWSCGQLFDGIAAQGFEHRRARYLSGHLEAFRTVTRRLNGERLSLEEEVRGCFDLDVRWVPETLFEEAHALYDRSLPGRGSLAERLRAWQSSHTLAPDRSHLLVSLLRRALAHARKATDAILPLPADERADVELVDLQVRAFAAYKGGRRSRILIDPAVPFPLTDLFYVVCHEAYPGHITEVVLKEEALVERRGCLEQHARFLLTPAYVVSEGLALLAHEVIFAHGEEERWLAEHAYPEAGMTPDGDLHAVHRARDLLRGASCNAAFMLREGRPDGDVLAYLMRHVLLDEEGARRELASLSRPFCEAYTFTYFHGRRLVEGMLTGSRRPQNLRWLMIEQVLPSELEQRSG